MTKPSVDGATPTEPVNRVEDVEKPEPDIWDPFAPENLKLSQDVLDQLATTALLTTIPVCRPSDQTFTRVHPDEAYHFTAALISHDEERSARYLIHPIYLPDVIKSTNIKFHMEKLFLYTTRQGGLGLWPVKIPKDQRENTWLESAMGAIEAAIEEWVCVTSNMHRKMYITEKARGKFPEPNWEALLQGKTIFQILAIAFKERLILNEEHPLIQKLLGVI
jgi:hypothetical protein